MRRRTAPAAATRFRPAATAGARLLPAAAAAALAAALLTLAAPAGAGAAAPELVTQTAGGAGAAPEAPAAPGAPADSGEGAPICDASSALTLIGMDTRSGEMLFGVPGPEGGSRGGWVVRLDGSGSDARAYPDRAGSRYGGSIGPGPVVAVESCGTDCVQPLRWEDSAWRPLGESVTLPAGSTTAATYDESGAPWLMAHAATKQAGLLQAWAYRYEAHLWKSRGGLAVTAVGQPQVTPSPQHPDGVLSGTGLFTAGGPPSTWVEGLPGLPPDRRGQLVALTGSDAAYVSADGIAYLSADGGKSWRRSTWTPWGGDTTGMWRQGADYGIDLPASDHRGVLRLVWYDRRIATAEKVVLTRLGQHGEWSQVAEVPADVTSRNGDHLPVTQVLVPRGDSWILLSGCVTTAAGPGLVLRSVEHGVASAPRFLPLAAAR
jgi:hypothetical protein